MRWSNSNRAILAGIVEADAKVMCRHSAPEDEVILRTSPRSINAFENSERFRALRASLNPRQGTRKPMKPKQSNKGENFESVSNESAGQEIKSIFAPPSLFWSELAEIERDEPAICARSSKIGIMIVVQCAA